MAIFQKEPKITGITDRMTLGGYTFDARIIVSEKNGNATTIHRGRILFFEILCEDEVISYFDEGQWYMTPARDFEEGLLAQEMLIQKWNRPGQTAGTYKDEQVLEEWRASNADQE